LHDLLTGLVDAVGRTVAQRAGDVAFPSDEPASAPTLSSVESAAALNSSPQW
jgi:hypothetical protein